MYKVLEDMDDNLLTLEDLQNDWDEAFDFIEDFGKIHRSYEDFLKSNFYDKTTYILDTMTNICYKANDFFHAHARKTLS
ncbi:MAG: hypothetical protein K5648_06760 [Erysipelotrichaceae bacterium]|nr:hypothetical protein [Erysipelotrichaceae bacterium]